MTNDKWTGAQITNDNWAGAQSVADEALRIVQGQRNADYDEPEQNHGRVATIWSTLLDTKLTEPLTAADVCRLMVGLKLVRDAHRPKRDNRVDMIGYNLNLERVEPTDAPTPDPSPLDDRVRFHGAQTDPHTITVSLGELLGYPAHMKTVDLTERLAGYDQPHAPVCTCDDCASEYCDGMGGTHGA